LNSIFVTGTGTDIGKSGVSLALCIYLKMLGQSVAYFKPLQSGSVLGPAGDALGDGEWVKYLTPHKLEIYHSYQFSDPVSPHLAAEREGKIIDIGKIRKDFNNLKKNYDFVVVEGTGGIAVPLNEEGVTLIDVLSPLQIPTLLVTSPLLGTLNHTQLTYFFMDKKGMQPAGFVVAHLSETVPTIAENNRMTIQKLTGMKFFGYLPYVSAVNTLSKLSEESTQRLLSGFSTEFKTWLTQS